MKKLVIVLLALLVAGSAFAAKAPVGDVTPNMAGVMDPSRDALVSFTDFFALGLNFSLVDPDPAIGTVNAAFGDFEMLEDGTEFTYCADLTLLVANLDLSVVLLNIGGDFVDFGWGQ